MESYIWSNDSVSLAGGMQRLRFRSKNDGGRGKGEQMTQITEALNEKCYESRRAFCWRVFRSAEVRFSCVACISANASCVRGSGTTNFALSLSECHLHHEPSSLTRKLLLSFRLLLPHLLSSLRSFDPLVADLILGVTSSVSLHSSKTTVPSLRRQ
jgi:hypothetical protein